MTENGSVLQRLIREKSIKTKDRAGREIVVLEDRHATTLSDKCHCHVHDIYEAALMRGVCPYRYVRNINTFSLKDMLVLAKSSVAVIGAGGLGGYAVLLLARIGIGKMVIVDSDIFDETNLNRQALSCESRLGAPKAIEAENEVMAINPSVLVDAHCTRLTAENAHQLLDKTKVAIDALDNLPDRLLLEKTCRNMGIPMVHGAIAGFEGRLMTIFPEDPGLTSLHGTGKSMPEASKNPEVVLGVPGIAPSLIATLQVMEVVKILLDRGKLLRNTLLHLDLEYGEAQKFAIERHSEV